MMTVYTARTTEQLQDALFEKIGEQLELLRSGRLRAERIILIVPAQFTLKAEEAAFSALKSEGFFDFHIMSGNKLEHDILRETGGPGLTPVNSLGRTMILRRTAEELRPSLTSFSKVSSDRGFLKLAADFILQMKQNKLTSKDIEELLERLDPSGLLHGKLSDMKLIFEGYTKAMEGRFTDSEDLLSFITARLSQSEFVKTSQIWYFGFHSFTARDADFLAGLAKHSAGLSIMLQKGGASPEDAELFSPSLRTLSKLERVCLEEGVPFSCEALSCGDAPLLSEPVFFRCANPNSQAETIAAEIIRLVRDEGRSFSEMAVLTADAPGQAEPIARVLKAQGIPVFMDSRRPVMHSPAAALISALLDIAADGCREESVISFIRQGLVDLSPEEEEWDAEEYEELADEFADYVHRYRLRGKAFFSPLKYGRKDVGDLLFSRLEMFREQFAALAQDFTAEFSAARTAGEKCSALYRFMEDRLKLSTVLEQKAVALAEDGMPDAAEETAQVYGCICGLLDQAVTLIGDEPISNRDFRELIEASLSDIEVGVLPQAEGRVQLGTVTRSRLFGIDILFVAGFNEGLIPSASQSDTLLTQRELIGLEELGYTFSKRSELIAAEEMLEISNTLSHPASLRYFSWCAQGSDSEALRQSRLITDMADEWPNAELRCDVENSEDPLARLQSGASKTAVFRAMRSAADSADPQRALSEIWKAAYNAVIGEDPALAGKTAGAVFYRTDAEKLSESEAKSLFAVNGSYSFSSSRLEKYTSCPFSHFIRYGLKPSEAEPFEIGRSTAGRIYHDALMTLSAELTRPAKLKGIAVTDPGSLWMTVTDEELESMLSGIIDRLGREKYDSLLSATHGEVYRTDRIKKTCLSFAKQMVSQVRLGNIRDMSFETEFGRGKAIPPIVISTESGPVYIEGRIDRVDMIEGSDGNYVKVIDYKSGAKRFDRKKIEQGYSLQLATYMSAASQDRGADGAAAPGGMFYFLIKEPEIDASLPEMAAESLSERVYTAIKKEYSLSGMVVSDEKLLEGIDSGIASDGRSDILSYSTTKEGKPRCSMLVSREEFESFLSDFRATLEKVCSRLTSGEISPHPANLGSNLTACSYCDYRSICLFGVDSGK